MVFQPSRLHAYATAVAFASGLSSSMFASALTAYSVSDCADLAPLTTGETLTDDVSVFLEDSLSFTCDEVTTVYANGGYKFDVTSDNYDVAFSGIRFEITNGAEFSLNLAAGEDVSTATFTGVTDQASDGGVFSVDGESSATFGNAMVFEDNSLTASNHGGAVYAGGKVDFEYAATFTGNKIMRGGEDYNLGGGGAVAIGADTGSVTFHDFVYFTGNEVRGGGRGGGIENLGTAYFSRASYFMKNVVSEDGDEIGGEGGAIYTGEGSVTTFKRRTIHHDNEAGNGGGALWNEGTTTLMSNGFLKGNAAMGIDSAKGGHIWTSGAVTVGGFVNLRDGFSRQDGGAVYIATGGSLDVDGLVTLERNSATESCDDVYPC